MCHVGDFVTRFWCQVIVNDKGFQKGIVVVRVVGSSHGGAEGGEPSSYLC